ncbi:hypothetical protein RFI_32712 [Reticulomyxa filosa]|uniref:Uncharacterized protein n=1 Tax=Reticulomyxa filosa TaxID=46433 RepID=X6LRZ8_RETFI|nr:hypothetical protein RFI_32712 [Reticulomyxa filosa]|eukprot:ETO04683.1 hypothetical protein RFI_32712 [Reticulomyxa filosa]
MKFTQTPFLSYFVCSLPESGNENEKLEKSELDGIEALKNLIIMEVPQMSGETLRLVLGLLKKLNEQLTMSTELYGLDHMSGGNMPMKQGKIFVMLEWLFSRMDKDDFMDIWPFEELNHLLSDCMAYLMDTSRIIHKCQSLMGLLASSRPQEFDVEIIQQYIHKQSACIAQFQTTEKNMKELWKWLPALTPTPPPSSHQALSKSKHDSSSSSSSLSSLALALASNSIKKNSHSKFKPPADSSDGASVELDDTQSGSNEIESVGG